MGAFAREAATSRYQLVVILSTHFILPISCPRKRQLAPSWFVHYFLE